jgi:hypothetical protein
MGKPHQTTKTSDYPAKNQEVSSTAPSTFSAAGADEFFSMMDDIPFLYLDAASTNATSIAEAHSTEEDMRFSVRSGESPTSAMMLSTPCKNTSTWDGRTSHNFTEQDSSNGRCNIKIRMRPYLPTRSIFDDSELISNTEDLEEEDDEEDSANTQHQEEHYTSRKVLFDTKTTPPSTPRQLKIRNRSTPPPVRGEKELSFMDLLSLPALAHDEEGICMPFLSCF